MTRFKQPIITFLGFFMLLVSGIADIGAIMTLANGLRWLIALFILTVGYLIGEQALHAWHNYRTFRAKLADIRWLIQHRGRDDIIRQATQALKIYQQPQPLIRISHIQSPNVVVVELNRLTFENCNDLLGMNFTITSLSGAAQTEGTITLCNQTQAHLQLHQPSTSIQVGDIVTPIKPSEATELECLCAELLLIIESSDDFSR